MSAHTEKKEQKNETLNPLALAKLLGPSNPKMDHFVRFFNTVRGTDKVLMFVQYWSKVVVWFLRRQKRSNSSAVVKRILSLAGPVSDFRILLRYYGLVPIVQYMNYLEYHPPSSTLALAIERLQNLSMIIYYPLEHIYWLGAHEVVPISEDKTNKIGMWSCRFWAAYVFLEYGRLLEQYRDIKRRETSLLKRIKGGDLAENEDPSVEMATIKNERWTLQVNTIINTGYLPLTVHWSIEQSRFPDVLVGVFGGIASIFQVYAAWKATA